MVSGSRSRLKQEPTNGRAAAVLQEGAKNNMITFKIVHHMSVAVCIGSLESTKNLGLLSEDCGFGILTSVLGLGNSRRGLRS